MYTIGEAADRAGLSVDLLRQWERRYAVVSPGRTESGYRLYDDAAIARVRAMRQMVDEGWTPSSAAASLRDVADADLPPRTASESPIAESRTRSAELVERFVDAAAEMDVAVLDEVLDEFAARAVFERTLAHHLFPALRALGDAWAEGRVSVAAEHLASGTVERWLGRAYEAAGSSVDGARPVLIGLPPGARHELGALAFATAARRGGLSVQYLGADLPADDWVRAAHVSDAAAAVIAVPTADDVDAARSVGRLLRRRAPGTVVVFGGSGAAGMSRERVLAGDIPDAVRDLRSRLRR